MLTNEAVAIDGEQAQDVAILFHSGRIDDHEGQIREGQGRFRPSGDVIRHYLSFPFMRDERSYVVHASSRSPMVAYLSTLRVEMICGTGPVQSANSRQSSIQCLSAWAQ